MSKKTIIFLLGFNLIIAAAVIAYYEYSKPVVYYIDLQKVYAEFELKKELEKKLEAVNGYTRHYLDSLEIKAGGINQAIQETGNNEGLAEYNMIASVYQEKSREFDAQKSKMAEEYDQQIWGQLNEYVKQYGKEKHCALIVAGNGDGSIMYADEKKDITEKMIVYVNNKYKGN